MPALIIIAFIALVGAGFYLAWYLKQKRIKELAAAAVQLGLQFSVDDPFGTLSEPFQLLRKGDGQGVENVMWGSWRGLELRQFDFWYYEESSDSKGNRSRTYYRFSCVLCPIDAACASLTIDHENLFTRLADALSFHDIEFESEEFNRKYNVKCSDKKFANDFVDARMIEWLMRHGDGYSFEACADQLLVAHRWLQPVELTPLLGTAQGFSKTVPRVVFELYPKG
jgi:hypothetical protein